MLILFGIIMWLILGFCTYLWQVKTTYTTYFSWFDFLFITCLGLISFIIMLLYELIFKFKIIMKNLIEKLNK